MNNKIVAGILILIFVGIAAGNVLAPDSWGKGYKLYNVNGSYWNLMGEYGIQNGSMKNMTNINSTYMNATTSINISEATYFGRLATAPTATNLSGSTYYNTTSDKPCYQNATRWINYNLSDGADRTVGC